MLHFALLNQFFDRAGDFLDRHIRVHPVLVEQIDRFKFEALKRSFNDPWDTRRIAIYATLRPAIAVEAELGGDNYLVAKWSERFSHQLFVRERAIHLGRVEKCNAEFHGLTDQ